MRPTTTATWPASSRRANRVLTWLRLPYEYLVLYAGLLLFGSSIFSWSVVAAVLYPLLPRRLGSRLGQFTIMALFRGFLGALNASGIVKLDLSALDALRDEGAMIIAPNHPSMLDAVLVGQRDDPAVGTIADFMVTGRIDRTQFGMASDRSFIADMVDLRIRVRLVLTPLRHRG